MSEFTNKTPLHRLKGVLQDAAMRNLSSQEEVLHAVYAEADIALVRTSWWLFTRTTPRPRLARAFVLTTERVLLLEESGELSASTAQQSYRVTSCPITHLIFLEARTYLLDCALTFVFAQASHVGRMTFAYSGVIRRQVLEALASLRAILETHSPQIAFLQHGREQQTACNSWWETFSSLSIAMKHNVIRYLTPGEQVETWLFLPTIDERSWWQRLGREVNELPAAVLVRTNRQLLVVRETKRLVLGGTAYGDDAWLISFSCLSSLALDTDSWRPHLRLTLEHQGVVERLTFPVPSHQRDQVLAFIQSYLECRRSDALGSADDPGGR